ncbi:hypothetical protein E2C01_061389 [Portunus trituberculatus]|uniref:Uncharacterized protein n=1 Tax=Portunus trituberculatus TaxID=210409 RepID=A0A5B7H524_PORTR|nr:hypothetical protein [Portunus trituberculatus]
MNTIQGLLFLCLTPLSLASKQPSCKKVLSVGEDKRKRNRQKDEEAKQQVVYALLPSVEGPCHDVNTPLQSADCSARDAHLNHLSMVISGLIAKFDGNPPAATASDGNPPAATASIGSGADFSGCAAASSEELDLFGIPQLAHSDTGGDNAGFLHALEELSDNFQGEEEKKSELLSEHMVAILNASLRCRLSSDGVKSTCSKIKLSSNMPNLFVPATTSAITSAMTIIGDKLIDMQLFYTNGLLSKALVPVAQCISDIKEGKEKPVSSYLEGFNNSLRLLASAVNFVNQLRKEVAQIQVNDLALVELCKGECAVGREKLFPSDVTKKCNEIHKTRKLGRPLFHPHRMSRPRRFAFYKLLSRRSFHPSQSQSRTSSRPFLGQKPPYLQINGSMILFMVRSLSFLLHLPKQTS